MDRVISGQVVLTYIRKLADQNQEMLADIFSSVASASVPVSGFCPELPSVMKYDIEV